MDILTLSLIPYNPLPDWNIQADIETSFLNQLGGENLTKVSKFTWKKKKPEAVYEHEIKRKELNDYFVQKNSIQIYAHLKVKLIMDRFI